MDNIVPTVQVVEQRVNPASTVQLERGMIKALQEKKKDLQGKLDAIYMGDDEYKSSLLQIQSLTDRIKELKDILKDSDIAGKDIKAVKYDIRNLNKQLKEHKAELSEALGDYVKETQQLTFEGFLVVKKYELKENK